MGGGRLSEEGFVDELFRRFLRRDADEGARAFYAARLREGASQLDIVQSIVTSQEFFDQLCRQAFGPQTGTPFLSFAPPGHFYSPIPSAGDVEALAGASLLVTPDACPGVNLRDDEQLAWLETLGPWGADLAFSEDPPEDPFEDPGVHHERHRRDPGAGGTRYYSENDGFGLGDATFLATFLRHLQPARIVEIGAGYSTAVMLDVAERHLTRAPRIDAIDPEPQRLRSLLRAGDGDRLTVHETLAQRLPLDFFTSLQANDVLFIDSSHVLKLGSDVGFLLLQVLPRLAPGVFVHIHDIGWPFDYRVDWYREGRAWNEAHAVHAFLAHNDAFHIVLFADYLVRRHRDAVRQHLPMALRQRRGLPADEHTACSLWLVKVP